MRSVGKKSGILSTFGIVMKRVIDEAGEFQDFEREVNYEPSTDSYRIVFTKYIDSLKKIMGFQVKITTEAVEAGMLELLLRSKVKELYERIEEEAGKSDNPSSRGFGMFEERLRD